jgi:hypothetical protein
MAKPRGNPTWKKGQSGNPNGRPAGRQDKYTAVRDAFFEVFFELGKPGLVDFAAKDIAGYYRVCAQLLPKEVDANVNQNNTGSIDLNVRILHPNVEEFRRLMAGDNPPGNGENQRVLGHDPDPESGL